MILIAKQVINESVPKQQCQSLVTDDLYDDICKWNCCSFNVLRPDIPYGDNTGFLA